MTKNQTQLALMIQIAADAHANQYDKGGHPYFLHPLAVMKILDTEDEELNCIAVGHDLVEDTHITAAHLIVAGFSARVVNAIVALTKIEGETYEQYQEKVLANYDAVRVKLADLTHNSDFRRLKGVEQKDLDRLAKYAKFYTILKAKAAEYAAGGALLKKLLP